MVTSSFEQLLSTLPNCDNFPLNDALPLGIGYISSSMPGFIPASLSTIEGTDDGIVPQVIVVSAPGAVGKSTLAREVAFHKGALLWDLAAASEVAANSLEGVLLKTLARGSTEDFLEYMAEGFQCVVIDALDEGRNKVNENSFQRFLEDIARMAQNSKSACFVLFWENKHSRNFLVDLGRKWSQCFNGFHRSIRTDTSQRIHRQ